MALFWPRSTVNMTCSVRSALARSLFLSLSVLFVFYYFANCRILGRGVLVFCKCLMMECQLSGILGFIHKVTLMTIGFFYHIFIS